LPFGLRQGRLERRRSRVAVILEAEERFFRRDSGQGQAFLNDPQAGLMGNDEVDVVEAEPRRLEEAVPGERHGLGRELGDPFPIDLESAIILVKARIVAPAVGVAEKAEETASENVMIVFGSASFRKKELWAAPTIRTRRRAPLRIMPQADSNASRKDTQLPTMLNDWAWILRPRFRIRSWR
jgi:hypothetical protein